MTMTLSGDGTIGGLTAGGLPDASVQTADIVDLNVTPAKLSQKLTLGTAVSASGTSIDFTGIPSWVKRITVMFNGVSTNGTSSMQIQVGTSGGVQATGYQSSCGGATTASLNTAGSSTTGFILVTAQAAANTWCGAIRINLLDSANGVCASEGTIASTTTTIQYYSSAGAKTLSGTLDRVRITTVNGTDTFDAGSINIMYEG